MLDTSKNLMDQVSVSQELTNRVAEEDNDLVALGLLTKVLREKRSEKFNEDWLPILEQMYPISNANHKYTIETQEYDILDYFPKANKLLIRKENTWIKPGLKWIINNLT